MLEHITACFKIADKRLPPGPRLVLLCLANMADLDGICWPSFAYIEARTNIKRRTIIEHIKLLASDDFKLIGIQERPHQSHIYTVFPGGADIALVQKTAGGGAENRTGVVQNLHEGGAKSAPRNNHINNHRTGKEQAKADAPACALPEWWPHSDFHQFVEMRKKIGKPISSNETVKRLIDKATRLREQGNDPAKVFQQSIDNCWAGLFRWKGDDDAKQSRGPAAGPQQRRGRAAAADLFNKQFAAGSGA